MKLKDSISSYRQPNFWVNSDDPRIEVLAQGLASAESAYRYVRDQIHHSFDVQAEEAPGTAREVLEAGHGLCFAKSHLLAAILRAMRIPSGMVYQRLLLGNTPDEGYCLHGLNAIYDASRDRWFRVDARGNRPGIEAEFSATTEQLAFTVQDNLGEIAYDLIYAQPPQCIQDFYRSNPVGVSVMCRTLPSELE